jgi:hypothetical protein
MGYKQSGDIFLQDGVVLKDERRTSNEKTITQYRTFKSIFVSLQPF